MSIFIDDTEDKKKDMDDRKEPDGKDIKETDNNDDSGIRGKGCELIVPLEEKKSLEEIENSLVKKFRKGIWTKFTKAVKEFHLVEEGDRIAVAVSGGKDSLIMAKLFQELKKHRQVSFEVEFITMDPGYHPQIRELLEENVAHLAIPTNVFSSPVFNVIDDIASDYPCYMCARMRRGYLYSKARELKCNKLALGHHFNDVIETMMLNLVYGGSFKAMPPKLRSSNYHDIELIRPLYYISEEDIIRWREYTGLMALNCACMVAAKRTGNRRYEIKDLIESMKRLNPDVEKNLLKASQNVYLDTVLGTVSKGERKDFNELYSERLKEGVWDFYMSGKVDNPGEEDQEDSKRDKRRIIIPGEDEL